MADNTHSVSSFMDFRKYPGHGQSPAELPIEVRLGVNVATAIGPVFNFSSQIALWRAGSNRALRPSPSENSSHPSHKEAFLKAIGVGLSGSLTYVSFRFDQPARIEFSGRSTIDPHEWHFALFEPVNNVRLGIVIRSVARPRFFMRQEKVMDVRSLPFACQRRPSRMLFSGTRFEKLRRKLSVLNIGPYHAKSFKAAMVMGVRALPHCRVIRRYSRRPPRASQADIVKNLVKRSGAVSRNCS